MSKLNDQVNTAPEPLKSYIHDLVSGYAGSAEMVQDNIALKDTAESLKQSLTAAEKENAAALSALPACKQKDERIAELEAVVEDFKGEAHKIIALINYAFSKGKAVDGDFIIGEITAALSRARSPSKVLDWVRAKEKEQAYLGVESYATEQAKEAEWKYGLGSSIGMTSIGHYFGNKARKAAALREPGKAWAT